MTLAFTYANTKPGYRVMWTQMVVDPTRLAEFAATAARLYKNIAVYKQIEAATGVPASVVMVIHEREADGDMRAYLGNGEPYSKVTTLVPKGRGPFATFIAGAIDALSYDSLTGLADWCIERTAFRLEGYNGDGYWLHGVPSPYVWGGTNQQKPGKYVKDGPDGWDPTVMDVQEGCMPLLSAIWAIDPSLRLYLDGQQPALPGQPPTPPAAPVTIPPPPDVEPPAPAPVDPPSASSGIVGGALIAAVIAALAVFGQTVATFIHHLLGG